MFVSFHNDMIDLSGDDSVTMAGITIQGPGIGNQMREIMEKETARVFREHGPQSFGSTKPASAIHEAGHVVIGTMIGKRVKRVRLKQNAVCGLASLNVTGARYSIRPPRILEKEARWIYAGIAAEMLFAKDDFREASSLDEVIMAQYLAAEVATMMNVDQQTYYEAEVHYVVGNWLLKHRAAVMKIAEYLVRHHKLRHPALGRLIEDIERVNPKQCDFAPHDQ